MKIPCDICDENGEELCHNCKGTGDDPNDETLECDICDGIGSIECGVCHGTGEIDNE